MFTKTNLISTIVAAIWSMMGGFFLWAVLAESILANHMGTATGIVKENPDFGILAIGCLIQGFAFSVIFRNWGTDKYTTMDGLKYGFWIGVLVGLGNNIIDYATSNMLDLAGALINGLIYIVFFCVMGFLVGLVYNKIK